MPLHVAATVQQPASYQTQPLLALPVQTALRLAHSNLKSSPASSELVILSVFGLCIPIPATAYATQQLESCNMAHCIRHKVPPPQAPACELPRCASDAGTDVGSISTPPLPPALPIVNTPPPVPPTPPTDVAPPP